MNKVLQLKFVLTAGLLTCFCQNNYSAVDIFKACKSGDEKLVTSHINKSNINCSDDNNNTPLIIAASRGYIDIVKKLLKVDGIEY